MPAPQQPAPQGTSPPAAPGPARLIAAGDVACAPPATPTATACRHDSVAMAGQSLAPEAVALLGDIQYEDGSLTNFNAVFHPSWGTRFEGRMRPVPGNHEYLTAGAAGYFDYFGTAAGERGRGYYSYDLGAWHLVALNSNTSCAEVACGAGSDQDAWLRQDLAAHAGACTIVYWHHPRFSSGGYGSNESVDQLWRSAVTAGADVALAGHAHMYERFSPLDADGQPAASGMRLFVVGTGGKSHHALATTHPASQARIAGVFGVLELTLHTSTYDWRFVDEAGVTRDSGSASCS